MSTRHILREQLYRKSDDTREQLSLVRRALRDLRFIVTHFDKPGEREMLCTVTALHFLKHAERELRSHGSAKGLSPKEKGPLLLAIIEREAGDRIEALEAHLKKETALIKKLDNMKED